MFGAALVILAATLAGWVQARQFASRPNQIRRLILALKRLETEIMYGLRRFPTRCGGSGNKARSR